MLSISPCNSRTTDHFDQNVNYSHAQKDGCCAAFPWRFRLPFLGVFCKRKARILRARVVPCDERRLICSPLPLGTLRQLAQGPSWLPASSSPALPPPSPAGFRPDAALCGFGLLQLKQFWLACSAMDCRLHSLAAGRISLFPLFMVFAGLSLTCKPAPGVPWQVFTVFWDPKAKTRAQKLDRKRGHGPPLSFSAFCWEIWR